MNIRRNADVTNHMPVFCALGQNIKSDIDRNEDMW